MKRKIVPIRLLIGLSSLLVAGSFKPVDERLVIAAQMENSVQTEMLNKWYPLAVDTVYGGFLSTFTYDFTPTGPQDKMIVTQARHIWTNARAAQRYPNVAYYKSSARHGFLFLRDRMWDQQYGGFYNLVDRAGNPKGRAIKEAYGNAFAIYGLAAYYRASGDTAALNLAKRAFNWLEKYSHDPIYKGYYQHLNRDGSPVLRDSQVPSTSDLGYKDQNSSIHLLEALTELYAVWPNPLVRARLGEMLQLIRDTITTPGGNLVLFFSPNWTPVTFRDSSDAVILAHHTLDHISAGHDVETAYLMLEASHALGLKNDTLTQQVAKRMVDQALKNAWDTTVGGFYDEGYYFKNKPGLTITRSTKNWWAQAEGLNTLLLMADQYPNDPLQYMEKYKQLWQYTQTYLIDHQYGDWYEGGLDKEPERKTGLKGHIWKSAYHTYRSLTNCVDRSRSH